MSSYQYWLLTMSGIVGTWLFEPLFLRRLRNRHPVEFSRLGKPSMLAMILFRLPWGQQAQTRRRWSRFLWAGEWVKIGDRPLSALGLATLLSGMAVIAGFAGFLLASLGGWPNG